MPEAAVGLDNLLGPGDGSPGLEALNPSEGEHVGLDALLDGVKDKAEEKVVETEAKVEEKPEVKEDVEVKPLFAKAEKPEDKVVEDLWKDVDIDDTAKKLLVKSSSKEVRQYVAGKLREISSLKKGLEEAKKTPAANGNGIDKSYYEDPEAYILHKDVAAIGDEVKLNNEILQTWIEQLGEVEEGKDVYDVFVKDGKVVVGDKPIKPTGLVKSQINSRILAIQSRNERLTERFQSVKEAHVNEHKQLVNRIEAVRKETFPHWQKPETKESRENVKKLLLEKTGISDRNPGFELMTDMALEIFQLHSALEAKNGEQTTKDPNSSNITSPRSKEKSPVDEEEIEKMGKFLKEDGEL